MVCFDWLNKGECRREGCKYDHPRTLRVKVKGWAAKAKEKMEVRQDVRTIRTNPASPKIRIRMESSNGVSSFK